MPSSDASTVPNPPAPSARLRASDLPLALLAVLVAGGLLYQVSIGVDLSDEAYYATFVDAWLKSGIGGSTILILHQTAALLVYPFVRLFHALTGGEAGLMPFLRALYLLLPIGAAAAVYAFVAGLQGRRAALLVALYILSFVPFSLPAPSYNTIGMSGVAAGAMLTGLFLRAPALPDPPRIGIGLLAALAWTTAAVAYPTLVAIAPTLLLGGVLLLDGEGMRKRILLLALLCFAGHLLGLALLLAAFGPGGLVEMLRFTGGALGDYAEPAGKWSRTAGLFRLHPAFAASCAAAAGLGVWMGALGRARRGHAAACLLLLAVLLPASRAWGAALFVHAHDLVLLLTVFGLFAVIVPPAPATVPPPRLVRLIGGVGLLGGLATMASATNGLYNYPIGGLLAAVVALAFGVPAEMLRRSALVRAAHGALVAGAVLTNGATSFAFIYGEVRNPLAAPAVRVASGPFAGLLTTVDQARYIEAVTGLLAQHETANGRVTMLGRLPGLYLLTGMAPSTLSTWNFSQHTGALPRLEALTDAFFAEPPHVPDLLGVDRDPWTRPPTPAEERLLSRYVPVGSVAVGDRSFVLHRRAASP